MESRKWEGVSSYQLSVNGNHRPRMSHECSNGREAYSFIRAKFVDGCFSDEEGRSLLRREVKINKDIILI